MHPRWIEARAWARRQAFRAWTALAILGGFAFGWVYMPEALTWWKRSTTGAIEDFCNLLPYPWGDRLETTLGNFGLWVQITLAILLFRILVSLATSGLGLAWRHRPGRRAKGGIERVDAVDAGGGQDGATPRAEPTSERAEDARGQVREPG